MKTKNVKCSLWLLLFPLLAFAGSKGQEVEKTINREFNIRTDGYLEIENRYGSIDIAIGESNQIKIEVAIRVEASNTKKAQETLDRIQIQFEEGNNRVEAFTDIESTSGLMSWFETGNVEIEINYHVLAPADIYFDLTNKYGDIYVETTNRDIEVNLGYGDIRLGDINAKLTLEMAYSDGALSLIRDGEMILSYSDLEMEDAQTVNIDMKYSDLVMGSAVKTKVVAAYSDLRAIYLDDFHYQGKYDDVVVERVKNIDYESAYSGLKIGGLSQSGDFSIRYGDLHINGIANGFSKLNINTSYTDVALDFSPGTAFTVDALNNYCDIQHTDLKITEHIDKGTSVTLKANRGSGGGQVYARMNYGELSIE